MSYDDRLAEHRRRFERRLAAVRRAAGDRDRLRVLRRAAASPKPRQEHRGRSRRYGPVVLATAFFTVVVVLALVDQADGAA